MINFILKLTFSSRKFNHNKKAGIAPTYGSQVNSYNVESAYNSIGLQAVSTSDFPIREIISSNCLYHDNNYNMSVEHTIVKSWNDKQINGKYNNVIQNDGILNIL